MEWSWTEYILIVLAAINSIALACYDYSDRECKSGANYGLDILCYFFTGIFGLEIAAKIIAFGFAKHTKSFLRSGWNLFDFLIVLFG
jgi:hypothetical protein